MEGERATKEFICRYEQPLGHGQWWGGGLGRGVGWGGMGHWGDKGTFVIF